MWTTERCSLQDSTKAICVWLWWGLVILHPTETVLCQVLLYLNRIVKCPPVCASNVIQHEIIKAPYRGRVIIQCPFNKNLLGCSWSFENITISKSTASIWFRPFPFLKKLPFLASFSFIFVFSIQLTVNNVQYKCLPMTGFEPRTSGIGSDRSTNWATTTAHHLFIYCETVTDHVK